MAIVLILTLWVAPLALGIYMGNRRGKLAAGILLPLFLGWIGVIIIACLSDRSAHVIVQNTTTVFAPQVPPAGVTESTDEVVDYLPHINTTGTAKDGE